MVVAALVMIINLSFFISWGNLPVRFLFTDRSNTTDSYKQYEWLTDFTHAKDNTLTCSFEVTAQNTISVKFCEGNMRKQIPPIGLLSLTKARVLCFLQNKTTYNQQQCISHRTCTNSSRECKLYDTISILLDLLLYWQCLQLRPCISVENRIFKLQLGFHKTQVRFASAWSKEFLGAYKMAYFSSFTG